MASTPSEQPNKPSSTAGHLPSARTDREGSEPKISFGQAPIWFVLLCALLFFLGQVYVDNYAGGFDPKVYGPFASAQALADAVPKSEDGDLIAKGKVLFGQNCAACHAATGQGMAGICPPLALSEWVNTRDPSRVIRIPLQGLTGQVKVAGQDWDKSMVAFGENLKDYDIAAILSYVRQEWGNTSPVVKPGQVKAVRDATAGRTQQWTAAELQAIPLAP